MIKAIFFDFDGVILDSVEVKTQVFYNMYVQYGEEIAKEVANHHVKFGGISRFEKFRYYHKEFLGIELSEKEISDLSEQFGRMVFLAVLESPFVTGAKEFISTEKQRDLWIISGTPTVELHEICHQLGLSQYFKGIYGSPDRKAYWGEKILKEKAYERNQVLFIGDALTDYETALECGLNFLLRETELNRVYFKNYNGKRAQDLSNLNLLLKEF